MLSIVDLVVPNDGAAVCPDLNASQGIAIDVVAFYKTPSIAKYVNTALVPVEDGVAPEHDRQKELVLLEHNHTKDYRRLQ